MIFFDKKDALKRASNKQKRAYLNFLAGLLELWGKANMNDNEAISEIEGELKGKFTKGKLVADWGTPESLARHLIDTDDFPDASSASNMRSVFRNMAVEPTEWGTYVEEVRTADSWNKLLEDRGVRKSKKSGSGSTKSTAGQKINMTSGDVFKVTFPAGTLPSSLEDESLCYVKRDPNDINALLILGVYANGNDSIARIIGGKDNVLL